MRFRIGQKWVGKDRKLYAQVTEISDEGRRGVVVITDQSGNLVDTFRGTAAAFFSRGQWQPA